jgi:hypothetical protein
MLDALERTADVLEFASRKWAGKAAPNQRYVLGESGVRRYVIQEAGIALGRRQIPFAVTTALDAPPHATQQARRRRTRSTDAGIRLRQRCDLFER